MSNDCTRVEFGTFPKYSYVQRTFNVCLKQEYLLLFFMSQDDKYREILLSRKKDRPPRHRL